MRLAGCTLFLCDPSPWSDAARRPWSCFLSLDAGLPRHRHDLHGWRIEEALSQPISWMLLGAGLLWIRGSGDIGTGRPGFPDPLIS